jgi:hypothetical protein
MITLPQVKLPALLRFVMRNARTHIAETDSRVRPLIRLADGSCMSVTTVFVTTMSLTTKSVMTWGPNFQPEAGLIRKARV